MLFSHRLLVAVDESPQAPAALAWASRLAAAFAGVDVVHVWLSTHEVPPTKARDESGAWLKKLVASVKFRGTRNVGRRVEFGDPSMVLLQFALRRSGDLIVMGLRGEGDASPIGRVASNLLRSAPCPILFVSQPPASDSKPLRILVPTDFSMASMGALRFAGTIAQEAGGTVDVLHVVTPEELADDVVAKRKAKLADFVVEGAQANAGQRVVVGVPAAVIAETAAAGAYDLLVINAHGLTGTKGGSAVGSVAERVTYAHPCATLVARDHFSLPPRE